VYNCNNQSCLYIFLCSSNIWSFRYSFANLLYVPLIMMWSLGEVPVS